MINDFKLTRRPFLLLAGVFMAAALYWAFCNRRSCHALQAIPPQTALVLVFNGFDPDTTLVGLFGPDINPLPLCRKLTGDYRQAMLVFQQIAPIREAAVNRTLAAAFSLHPTDSLHPLFVLDIGRSIDLKKALQPVMAASIVLPSVFKGHVLYAIQNARQEKIVVATFQNLLLFSRYSYILEDALVQLEHRDQWWAGKWSAGNSDGKPVPFQCILRPDVLAERLRGNMSPVWEFLPEWAANQIDWVSVVRDERSWRLINGRHNALPTSKPAEGFSRQSFYSILPDNVAFFVWSGLPAGSSRNNILPAHASNGDFDRFIKPWLGDAAAFVIAEPFTPGMLDDQFLVFQIQDSALASLKLQEYGSERGFLRQYDYQTFSVKQYLSQSLVAPLLGRNSVAFQNPVCTIIGNYVLFAPSPSAIELWIDKYVVSQTLSNSPDFLQMQQAWQTDETHAIYLNATYLPLLVKNLLNDDANSALNTEVSVARQAGLLAVDFKDNRAGKWDACIIRQPVSGARAGTSILWKAALLGEATGTPYLVPLNEGSEMAVFIQDDLLHLYRLSAGGSILWKKQLDERILSPVQGIDYYKNGRYCFLFNTATAIWIINDEGEEIAGFPLKLQSPATNGVTAVDFDDTRNHTLFVACANNNLYGFDQFGRPLTGWNPQAGVGEVLSPLVHFNSRTKDFLAVLSATGKLSVFNRNGTPHFPPVQFDGDFSHCPPQFDNGSLAPRIVCTDTRGRAHVCSLDGQTFSLSLSAPGDGIPHFVFANFFGDDRFDFALQRGENISFSGYENGSFGLQYSLKLPSGQDSLFQAGCCGSLGTVNRQKRQIFLINNRGKVHSDFPLAGTTPFVMGRLFPNRLENILVVGNGKSVYAYKVH